MKSELFVPIVIGMSDSPMTVLFLSPKEKNAVIGLFLPESDDLAKIIYV